MADTAFKTVGKKGKGVDTEDIRIKNEEKRLRDEGKILFIRFERYVKESEAFNFTRAAADVIKVAVNNHDDTSLISIDGNDYMDKFIGLTNNKEALKYFTPLETTFRSKTTSRIAFIIKIKVEHTTFFELKNSAEMLETIHKWNWTMRRHELSPEQADVRLVFNVFKINPFLIGKGEHGKMMDNEIKDFAKKMPVEMKNKLGASFCKWIENTKESTVEIGTRKFMCDAEYENKTVIMDSVVLTVSVENRFLQPLKDIIKSIKWNESKYGTMVEENPTKNNTLSNLMLEHNEKCRESAYLKVNFLPAQVLKSRLSGNPAFLESVILRKTTIDEDKVTTYLIKSINPIRRDTGMYFLVTTKYLLDKAEVFISDLMRKASETDEFKNDNTLINPDKSMITVTNRNNSKAGSEVSDMSKANQIKQQMDKSSKYYKSANISMSSGKNKPEDRRVPPTVTCSNRMNFGKEDSDSENGEKKKTYAEMAKSISSNTDKKQETIEIDDESELSSDDEEMEHNSKSTAANVIDNSVIQKLLDEINSIKAKQAEDAIMHANEREIYRQEIADLRKANALKQIEHDSDMKKQKLEYEALKEEYTAIKNKETTEKMSDDIKISKSLFVESPMPSHKEKRSKTMISGTKRVTVSTNVSTRKTLSDGSMTDNEETLQGITEDEEGEEKIVIKRTPPKQPKISHTLLSPEVKQMKVTEQETESGTEEKDDTEETITFMFDGGTNYNEEETTSTIVMTFDNDKVITGDNANDEDMEGNDEMDKKPKAQTKTTKSKESKKAKKTSSLIAATAAKILHPGGKPPGKGV